MRLIRHVLLIMGIAVLAACATAELSKTDKATLMSASSGSGRGTAVVFGQMRSNEVLATGGAVLLKKAVTQVRMRVDRAWSSRLT